MRHSKQEQEIENPLEGMGFNFEMLRRFKSISILLLRNPIAVGSLFLLIGFSLLNTWVVSYTGKVTGGFYTAILEDDKTSFYTVIWQSVLIILGSAICASTIQFFVDALAWKWRGIIYSKLQDGYFLRLNYYGIIGDQSVDNPDQRITQDVTNFTDTLSQIVSNCISAPVTIGLYGYRTWTMIVWYAPFIILGYFLIGYVAAKFIMNPIVRLVFKQEQLEGDFRYLHSRVRTYAESIAIYNGGQVEKSTSEKSFQSLMKNKISILRWQWNLNTVSNIFTYIGSVVNYIIVALPIFILSTGIQVNASYISEASFATIMLISGFSTVLNVSSMFGEIGGFTNRVGQLFDAISKLEREEADSSTSLALSNFGKRELVTRYAHFSNEVVINTNSRFNGKFEYLDSNLEPELSFENVTVYSPLESTLISNLTLQIMKNDDLIIMGEPGSGKSSIVRVLSGLWKSFDGVVKIPSEKSLIFYLPQRPYFFEGTLVQQILYPRNSRLTEMTNVRQSDVIKNIKELENMLDLLLACGFSKIVGINLNETKEFFASGKKKRSPPSLDVEYEYESNDVNVQALITLFFKRYRWSDVLSPGEQQMLSFCRLFYRKPIFAILDEATSSLSERTERLLYQQCKEVFGCTIISTAHRTSLLPFHKNILTIHSPKSHTIEPIKLHTTIN